MATFKKDGSIVLENGLKIEHPGPKMVKAMAKVAAFLVGCTCCASLKRKISQRLRHADASELRLMARPPRGFWYRKRWLRNHEIPLGTATESYLKKRLLEELGPQAFLK